MISNVIRLKFLRQFVKSQPDDLWAWNEVEFPNTSRRIDVLFKKFKSFEFQRVQITIDANHRLTYKEVDRIADFVRRGIAYHSRNESVCLRCAQWADQCACEGSIDDH